MSRRRSSGDAFNPARIPSPPALDTWAASSGPATRPMPDCTIGWRMFSTRDSEVISTLSPSTWSTIRDALRGTAADYTREPIGRAVLLLAIPMVVELVLESVFAVVDVFFVSRLGADAVATVGLTEAVMTIVYSVAMGLGMGATATVARRIGERDTDGAAIAAVQAIAIGLIVAVPTGVAGFTFARSILGVM